MSKFNKSGSTTKTTNLAGGDAYVQNPKVELVSILLTSFVQNQFYRSEDETLQRVVDLIDSTTDKKFIAKAAIYARNEFGMRSISHVVAGELAKRVKGEVWSKNFYNKVVYRPDDITEILSYYKGKYGKPIPNSLKKGLGLAFRKFDSYQIAKYRGEAKEFSLVDAVNVVHPKVGGDTQGAIHQLIEGTLHSTETWESKLTEAGKKATNDEEKQQFKKEAWTSLITSRKLGYFALLKNLRNILEQAPDIVDLALEMLIDPILIRKSLVLPFRFLTATEEIQNTNFDKSRDALVAIAKATEIALSNVPVFEGKTLVALDNSGSMQGSGAKAPAAIGSLFASVLVKSNNADFMVFSDNASYLTLNPTDSLGSLSRQMIQGMAPGGTNFHAIFEEANKAYDRIIILSDMQGWIGQSAGQVSFNRYKTRIGANPIIYSFDLQGYGTLQFPERNVYEVAGFSDKVFDIMKLLEQDRNALVNKIDEIDL